MRFKAQSYQDVIEAFAEEMGGEMTLAHYPVKGDEKSLLRMVTQAAMAAEDILRQRHADTDQALSWDIRATRTLMRVILEAVQRFEGHYFDQCTIWPGMVMIDDAIISGIFETKESAEQLAEQRRARAQKLADSMFDNVTRTERLKKENPDEYFRQLSIVMSRHDGKE